MMVNIINIQPSSFEIVIEIFFYQMNFHFIFKYCLNLVDVVFGGEKRFYKRLFGDICPPSFLSFL